MKLWSKITSLWQRPAMEREMAEEMHLHLERRIEENIAAGMTPEDARYAALRKFGGVQQIKEECREVRSWVWLEHVLMDVRLALRQLRKAPGFATVSILTLAIGIGASTSIFSVVNSVILRPLAFPDSGRLVAIMESLLPQYPEIPPSPAIFFEWEEHTSALLSMGAANGYNGNLTGVGQPTRVFGYQVSARYFETLGVTPRIGRSFTAQESQEAMNVVILGHKLWMSHFEANDNAINRVVFLNGEPFTVIGVMADGFQTEPGSPILYVPLPTQGMMRVNFGSRTLRAVVGRLRTDATVDQAQRELDIITGRIAQAHPETHKNFMTKVTPMIETRVRGARPLLLTLCGAVGALLLIACVNVANLSLARASSRQGEIALRAALGAGRLRIVRQLLAESLVIAVIGGALGTLIAYYSMGALLSLAPIALPRIEEVKLDGTALAFSCAVTLLTGLSFGLLPAWQAARVNLAKVLDDGRRASDAPNRLHVRGVLVIVELALALMLLVGAGLLTKSFHELGKVRLGYDPKVLYSARFTLLPEKYRDDTARITFVNRVLEGLAGKPGIEAVAFTTALPHHQNPAALMAIDGRPESDRMKLPRVIHASVTPDYFKAMSNPLLAGRWFSDRDTRDAPQVAIVSEQLVKEYFNGESPLGKRIDLQTSIAPGWREIIGVVSDIKSQGPSRPTVAQVYLPFASGSSVQLMAAVRVTPGAPNPATVVAAEVHRVDPDMPVGFNLIAEFVGHSIEAPRFASSIFVIFAAVALMLAVIGIYGVMAYSVGQRTQEIGIRLALGAQHSDILTLILGQAGRLVAAGIIIGTAGALAGSRVLRSLLHDVSPYDFTTFIGISSILAAVAFVACWLPARRAAKLDPMITLRSG